MNRGRQWGQSLIGVLKSILLCHQKLATQDFKASKILAKRILQHCSFSKCLEPQNREFLCCLDSLWGRLVASLPQTYLL